MSTLDVHLDGHGVVGKLSSDERLSVSFVYTAGYAGPPLSVCLPIPAQADQPYGDVAGRAFFHGLLQEGWQLDQTASRNRIDRNDTVGLLAHIGRECAGAVSVVPEGAPPGKSPGNLDTDYAEIPPAQFALDIANLYARRPPRRRTRFSLAGVQSKMAAVVLPDGRVLEPLEGAPTTHLIKVGNADDEALVENELLVMKTAARLGLPVVTCSMGRANDIPYLVVPRFDRVLEGRLVRRLHQEDACQALGLPSTMKYEEKGDPADPGRVASFANLFLLGQRTGDPLGFTKEVLAISFYNFLAGNCDAHAKNFALLHTGARPVLAPFYDLVCIALYEHAAQGLAMSIGGIATWENIGPNQWLSFLETAGIKGKGRDRIISKTFKPMAEAILPAMEAVLEEENLSMSRAAIIRDCVSERIIHLNGTLGWNVPVDTDAFITSGGGWQF